MNSFDQTIAGADALGRAVSWRLAVAEQPSATLVEDVAAELVAAITRGEVLAQPRRRADADHVRSGANDACGLRARLDNHSIDRGSLHAWFARTPATSAVADTKEIGSGSMTISPLQAVEILTQRAWTDGGLERLYARRAHVRGWSSDHEDATDALPADGRGAVFDWTERVDGDEKAFHAGRAKLMALAKRKAVSIWGRNADGHMRLLEKAAAFAPDIVLDVVAGRFMPAPHIEFATPEWDRAIGACAANGQVFFDAAELRAQRIRGERPTVARESAAARLLFDRFRKWVERGGRMCDAPKQADWLVGEGIEMVGSKIGAARAWARAVDSNPAFAALHKRGRRPGK